MKRIRILTLNLWCESEPFAERMDTVKQFLCAIKPDLVAFQEVVDRGSGECGARRIAEALDVSYTFGLVDPVSCVGNAILSRFPVLESVTIPLPSGPGDPRAVLAAQIKTPYGCLPFLATHFSWEPEHTPRRGAQALAVEELARQIPSDLPPIIAGDLNEIPEGDAISFLTGRRPLEGRLGAFQDAFAHCSPGLAGYTWSLRNPFTRGHGEDRRLDYVLVSSEGGAPAKILQAKVVLDQPGANGYFASDHFGVLVDLAWA